MAKVSRTTLRPLTSIWCFEMIYAVRCSSDPSLHLDLPICSQQSNISVSCFNTVNQFRSIYSDIALFKSYISFWVWLSLWKEITPVPTFLYHHNLQQCLTLDLQTATSVSGSSAAICDTSNKRMKWLLRGKKIKNICHEKYGNTEIILVQEMDIHLLCPKECDILIFHQLISIGYRKNAKCPTHLVLEHGKDFNGFDKTVIMQPISKSVLQYSRQVLSQSLRCSNFDKESPM